MIPVWRHYPDQYEICIKAVQDDEWITATYYVTDELFDREKLEGRGIVQIPLHFLAKSLEGMSYCHAVYFCRGWQDARGCRIEHDAAVAYGLEVIEE